MDLSTRPMSADSLWRVLGVSNVCDYVCRLARATTAGAWHQAQLEHVYAVRSAVYLNLNALERGLE
jgi:hypothetical protein